MNLGFLMPVKVRGGSVKCLLLCILCVFFTTLLFLDGTTDFVTISGEIREMLENFPNTILPPATEEEAATADVQIIKETNSGKLPCL
jgi:hypothetical protein